MVLRRAIKTDLKRIVEIYNSSIEWRLSTADTSAVSVQSKEGWFDSHFDMRPLLIYEDAGFIVAWVSIEAFHERPAYKNTVEISVYIDHEYIGKGIGTKMLKQIIGLLPDLEVKAAIANIYSHNEASIKLFRNCGFKKWGELPNVCEMDGNEYSVSILGLKV